MTRGEFVDLNGGPTSMPKRPRSDRGRPQVAGRLSRNVPGQGHRAATTYGSPASCIMIWDISMTRHADWNHFKIRSGPSVTYVSGINRNLCVQNGPSADGGQRGIRTLDTLSRIHAFQACAFNHSATCPSFGSRRSIRLDGEKQKLLRVAGNSGGRARYIPMIRAGSTGF